MSDEIPQWALDRAADVACYGSWSGLCDLCPDGSGTRKIAYVLARYIAQHEQPPVDPDLKKAREICALVAEELAKHEFFESMIWAADYRKGLYDNDTEVQFALSALKEARNG